MELMDCPCGLQHQMTPILQARMAVVLAFKRRLGDDIKVTNSSLGRSWLVPRVYIAIHGLLGRDIPELASRFGWKEIE